MVGEVVGETESEGEEVGEVVGEAVGENEGEGDGERDGELVGLGDGDDGEVGQPRRCNAARPCRECSPGGGGYGEAS